VRVANYDHDRPDPTSVYGPAEYPQIDRRAGLSLKEFSREYRSPGRPVVISDAIDGWRARSAWTFEFFKSRYGSIPVLVHKYRGERYRHIDATRMLLADYIDGVLSNSWESFPYYIRDNSALLSDHPELAGDYKYPEYFFDWYTLFPSFMRLPYPRIFIGPKGAVTPLHIDVWGTHGWLSQLAGRKRWVLFPPEQRNLLYDFKVEPDRPDLTRFPLFKQARPVECTVGPGETVFVPSGWAHWVVSLDPTISLGANYMGPGCFGPCLKNVMREMILKRAWNSSMRRLKRPGTRSETA
jgi:histone arginine demethylase JMJD6